MKKLLIVDDEEGIRFIYGEEFRDEGYDVFTAGNGEEALALFEQEKPDLVVLDIQMPGINGVEVLSRMKDLSPQTPVILSSAYPEFKQNIGVWASEEYVVKSSNLDPLKEVVRRYLK